MCCQACTKTEVAGSPSVALRQGGLHWQQGVSAKDSGHCGELVLVLFCRSLLTIADLSRPTAGLRVLTGSFSAVTGKALMNRLRSVQKRSRLAADQAHIPGHNKHAATEQDGSVCASWSRE